MTATNTTQLSYSLLSHGCSPGLFNHALHLLNTQPKGNQIQQRITNMISSTLMRKLPRKKLVSSRQVDML